MYEQVNNFDKNNMERIYNLLILKGEALLKGQMLVMRQKINHGFAYSNFFTAISDQVDIAVIYFINDEISASLEDRGPLLRLIEEIKARHYIDEHFKILEYAESDLKELFANRTDFVIGSTILDFKVNTFSVFEKYVCDLYDILLPDHQGSATKEKKLIKLIGEYSESDNEEAKSCILEKIKKISFYVSSAEKIEYVISKSEFHDLDKSEVRYFLNFYRSQRNSIHNMGIHKGESQSVTVKGIEIQLNKNSPSYTDNHNSAFFACQKLMKIYEEMHMSVTGEVAF